MLDALFLLWVANNNNMNIYNLPTNIPLPFAAAATATTTLSCLKYDDYDGMKMTRKLFCRIHHHAPLKLRNEKNDES